MITNKTKDLLQQLTWRQIEQLNILSMEYIKFISVENRPHPHKLIHKVATTNLTYNYSDEIIELKQAELLNKEISNIRKQNKRWKL